MFNRSVQTRPDARIFAGSDPAYTAHGAIYITTPTPAMTPLMLDPTNTALIIWNGTDAGHAVGILALDHDGVSKACSYYKSGTFDLDSILWGDDIVEAKKRNAFAGSAISID